MLVKFSCEFLVKEISIIVNNRECGIMNIVCAKYSLG